MAKKLFEINPDLDRAALAKRFSERSRVQVRDFLTRETAEEIRMILTKATPWGLAMQAEGSSFEGPQQILPQEMQSANGRQGTQAAGGKAIARGLRDR